MAGVFDLFTSIPKVSPVVDPMLQGNIASQAANAATSAAQAVTEDNEGGGGGGLLLIALAGAFVAFYMVRTAYMTGELTLENIFD